MTPRGCLKHLIHRVYHQCFGTSSVCVQSVNVTGHVSTEAHEICEFLGCQGLSVPRLLVYIEILYHRCHIVNQSICQHMFSYVFQSDELQSDSPFSARRLTLSPSLRAVNGCRFAVVLAVVNKPHSCKSV